MPLLKLMANRNLDSIGNPRLVRLKQKTLGWRFTVVYIPGKRLGGTDALSRYGVRHCQTEGAVFITESQHQCGSIAELPEIGRFPNPQVTNRPVGKASENIFSLDGSPSGVWEGESVEPKEPVHQLALPV